MSDLCYSCGRSYERLSTHWNTSKNCDYPSLSNYEKEVITGVLMGDGCISRQPDANPRLQVIMTNNIYVYYLSKELDRISSNVRLHRTAEQLADQKDSNPRHYSDAYCVTTKCLPDLQRFANWYQSGEKVFPSDLKITPTIFSHWYAGDGSKDRTKAIIYSTNEKNRFDNIEVMFERSKLPNPDRFGDEEIVWNKESSERLLSMTPVMPGFEYKWKNEAGQ